MAPEREAELRIIGDEVFAFGGLAQQGARLVDRHVAHEVALVARTEYVPAREVTMTGERSEGAARGQGIEVAARQAGSLHLIVEIGKGGSPARCLKLPCALLRQSLYKQESQAQRRWVRAVEFQRALVITVLHVHRPHLDTMAPRILHQLRGCIKAHGLTVEQSGGEGGGVSAFQPGGGVHQEREARSMRFGEAVFAEALYLLTDAFGEFLAALRGEQPCAEALLKRPEPAFAAPGRHGTAQLLGLAAGEAGHAHRDLHDLLLKDRYAQGALQYVFGDRGGIGDRLEALPAPQIWVDHVALDGTWPHQRDLDHEVVIALGFLARLHGHLRARLDLEHADRVRAPQHLIHGRVILREGRERVRAVAIITVDEVERATDRAQHAERQHVDLEQAHRVEVVLFPLDHGAVRHRRVLDRHQPRQRTVGDDEAADVLREVARKADQLVREREPAPDQRMVGIKAVLLYTFGCYVTPVPRKRLRHLLEPNSNEAQRLAHVAERALGAIADHGGSQCRALAAVFFVDILNDLLTSHVLEIDVDVGRLVAFLGDEALKEQGPALGVDGWGAGAGARRRGGGRAAPLAEDAAAIRLGDDVLHGEEIGFVVELGDQGEHANKLLLYRSGRAVWPAPAQAGLGQLAQMRARRLTGRRDLVGVLVAQLIEGKPAILGDAHTLSQQLGRVDPCKMGTRPQMALAVRKELRPGLGDGAAEADRGERVLQGAAAAHVHVHVAAGDQRNTELGGECALRVQTGMIGGAAQQLHGEPAAFGKLLRQPACLRDVVFGRR